MTRVVVVDISASRPSLLNKIITASQYGVDRLPFNSVAGALRQLLLRIPNYLIVVRSSGA